MAAASLVQTRAQVVTALVTKVAGLDEERASGFLAQAKALEVRPVKELEVFLRSPKATTEAVGDFPLAWVRLAHLLHTGGYPVVLPVCVGCGTPTTNLRPGPQGRVCPRCAPRRAPKTCARCGRTALIMARRAEGGICNRCYRQDPAVLVSCGRCTRLRPPAGRDDQGRPVCAQCWGRPLRTCAECGALAPTKANGPEGPLCQPCYRRTLQPRRICSSCGEFTRISCRSGTPADGVGEICYRCYRRPGIDASCTVCGRQRPCYRRRDGTLTCWACRPLPQRTCARCRRSRPVAANWPMGPVCPPCYHRIRSRPKPCAQCGTRRPLIGTAHLAEGAGICGPCAGAGPIPPCTACGNEEGAYADGQCLRCVVRHRVRDRITRPDGTQHPQLTSLVDALSDTTEPAGTLHWLSDSPSARLLIHLATAHQPISHDLMDELPHGHTERYLRHLLIAAGILPPRNDDLERIPTWLDGLLTDRPARHARLVRPFTTWVLLRRARRQAAGRLHTISAAQRIRRRVRQTLHLLDWLDAHHLELATLDQDRLDTWLSANRSHYEAKQFLDWAAQRGLTGPHTFATPPAAASGPVLTEEDRWQQLRRCLTDTALPLEVRVAGSLVLLYGIPGEHLRHLTTDEIHGSAPDKMFLRIGHGKLWVPPRLAELLHQLAQTPRRRSSLTRHLADQPPWLFPGVLPGHPLSRKAFNDQLACQGIQARPARTAALIALAAELPAPVLADLLGIHIHTALKWARHAQRDWSSYLVARTADLARHETMVSGYSPWNTCSGSTMLNGQSSKGN